VIIANDASEPAVAVTKYAASHGQFGSALEIVKPPVMTQNATTLAWRQ
jgi:hypothetical protein